MKNFDYSILENQTYDMEMIRLVSRIYMYKNKKYDEKKLLKLMDTTQLQSAYASLCMEDVKVSKSRLKKICLKDETVKNDAEKMVKGYYDVLRIIHMNYEHIPLQPHFILQMHKDLFQYTDEEAGIFKNIQNYVHGKDENGTDHTLFTPLAPYETLEAMDLICESYNTCIQQNKIEPLILMAAFIHDFLSIHPFLAGSGKMSRLLMQLLLLRSGYTIGFYNSIEQKIMENKEAYYASLMRCHSHWDENPCVDMDFMKLILRIILSCYEDLDSIMTNSNGKQKAYDQIVKVLSSFSTFTKRDVMEKCPMLSQKTVEACLKRLLDEHQIVKEGKGRATYYQRNLKPKKL